MHCIAPAAKVAIPLIIVMILAGCAATNETDDPFLNQIAGQYPDLNMDTYSIDTVKRVVDGDTFETATGQKVRLIGVDTPESVKPGSPVERFGKEASAFSEKELTGNKVYLFKDVSDTDRYGRLLRYVFVDGQPLMFNELLVKDGYANPLTIPPNVQFAEKFIALEREARDHKRGLWGDDDSASEPVEQACANPAIKGNINSRKERIYHVPGGQYYDSTIAEQMFCTEEEAENAGFRKSKR